MFQNMCSTLSLWGDCEKRYCEYGVRRVKFLGETIFIITYPLFHLFFTLFSLKNTYLKKLG